MADKPQDAIAKAEADVARMRQEAWDKQKAEGRKARGAGVYPAPEGFTVSITAPGGKLKDLGTFKTHEEAKRAYAAEQQKLYPPPPPVTVDPAKHHTVEAVGLTGAKPTTKLN